MFLRNKHPDTKYPRHKQWLLLCGIVSNIFLLMPLNTQAASPSALIPANILGSTPGQFGGPIKFTIDCGSASSCLVNPVCTLVRCIFQIPLIFQVFDNKKPSTPDAFTQAKKILEKTEQKNCSILCRTQPLYTAQCLNFSEFNFLNPIPYCPIGLAAFQKANASPGDRQVAALKKITGGSSTIGILFALYPIEYLIPACNGLGTILGKGLGEGVFFTLPTHSVGDSCRGNYYLNGTINSGI